MKLKTHKSFIKRLKIKKCNIFHKKAFKKHLLIHKSSTRLKRLSVTKKLKPCDFCKIKNNIY